MDVNKSYIHDAYVAQSMVNEKHAIYHSKMRAKLFFRPKLCVCVCAHK